MPRFDERTYRPALFSSAVERVVLGLVALCAACTAALALLLFAHRRAQTFQVAGLGFYMLVALGSLSACLSILTWGVENTAGSCGARVWVWSLSAHLFLAPLLAVAYRLARDASLKLYHDARVSRVRMVAGCCAIVAPQLLLNAMWTGLAPLRPVVVTEDPLRPAFTSFTSCGSDDATASTVFLALTLLYSGLLLLALCLLVQRARRAHRGGLLSDAGSIAAAVFLFVMTAAVVLVVQATLSHSDAESERVLFGLRSVGLLVAYQGSTVLLFLPRVLPLLSARGRLWNRVPSAKRRVSPAGTVEVQTVPPPLLAAGAVEVAQAALASPAAAAAAPSPSSIRLAAASPRFVHFQYPPSSSFASDHSLAQHRPGDFDHFAVAPLIATDLVGARGPLPPRQQLLDLPLEETVAIVAHYHSIIQRLRGGGGGGDGDKAAPAPSSEHALRLPGMARSASTRPQAQ